MPPSGPPSGPGDEASLLDLQGKIAWAAARETLQSMAEDLTRAVKPQAWVERYPLPATATAAAAGFFISGKIFAEEKPESKPNPEDLSEGPPHSQSTSGSDRSLQIWAMAISAAGNLLKEMLVPLVSSAWQNRKAAPEKPPAN